MDTTEQRFARWGSFAEQVRRQNQIEQREALDLLISEAVELTRVSCESVQIDPNTLYPMAKLEQLLTGTMSLKTFLENLRLDRTGKGRMFQNAVFGHEILEAMRRTAAGDQRQEIVPVLKPVSDPSRKRGRPRKQPVAKVRDIGNGGA